MPEIPLVMRSRLSTGLAALTLSLSLALPAAAHSVAQESSPQAMTRMKASARFLSSLSSFKLEARLAYDSADAAGRLIEVGETRRMSIRRPDRARVEVTRRDGVDHVFTANGKTMTFVREGDSRFAQEMQPGDLDHVVDAVIARIGIEPPLIDLLYSGLWQVLKPRIEFAKWIGSATINGVDCDHLYFENRDYTWQIWIDRGTHPLPRRLVVRYTRESGIPTMRADITTWEIEPKLDDDVFKLKPDSKAKRVSFKDMLPKRLPAGR